MVARWCYSEIRWDKYETTSIQNERALHTFLVRSFVDQRK